MLAKGSGGWFPCCSPAVPVLFPRCSPAVRGPGGDKRCPVALKNGRRIHQLRPRIFSLSVVDNTNVPATLT